MYAAFIFPASPVAAGLCVTSSRASNDSDLKLIYSGESDRASDLGVVSTQTVLPAVARDQLFTNKVRPKR